MAAVTLKQDEPRKGIETSADKRDQYCVGKLSIHMGNVVGTRGQRGDLVVSEIGEQ